MEENLTIKSPEWSGKCISGEKCHRQEEQQRQKPLGCELGIKNSRETRVARERARGIDKGNVS